MPETRMIVGCGYLGAPLAKLWAAAGHRVLATTRGGPGRAESILQLGAEPVLFDVTQGGRLPLADVVVTAVGMDRTQSHTMRDVYVLGLAKVFEALPKSYRAWLHVSSTSVYGQDDGGLVSEKSAAVGGDGSGRVVLEAEQLLQAHFPDATILRFGGIYGPDRLLKAKAIRQGDLLEGDPDRWLNLIHRDDGAQIIDWLAGNAVGHGEMFNVVDAEPVRRGDFYAELAKLMGKPSPEWRPRPPGSPPGPHEGNNRRVSSLKLANLPGFPAFKYPTFCEGLAASGPWN